MSVGKSSAGGEDEWPSVCTWTVARPARSCCPSATCPTAVQAGDWLHVFVYNDSDDRHDRDPRDTGRDGQTGECASSRSGSRTMSGLFSTGGLKRNLLVPFNEQAWPIHQGTPMWSVSISTRTRTHCRLDKKYNRHLSRDGRGVLRRVTK